MTLDELAKLVESTAKVMHLPVVKIVAVSGERPLDFGIRKRPPTGLKPVEPHVMCEIQKDGGMALGRMTVKLSEIKLLPGLNTLTFVDGNEDLIRQRLTEAAREAGIEQWRCKSSSGIRSPAI
jgi:hypothetical protein